MKCKDCNYYCFEHRKQYKTIFEPLINDIMTIDYMIDVFVCGYTHPSILIDNRIEACSNFKQKDKNYGRVN